jgi:hypothetical protein
MTRWRVKKRKSCRSEALVAQTAFEGQHGAGVGKDGALKDRALAHKDLGNGRCAA